MNLLLRFKIEKFGIAKITPCVTGSGAA